MNDTCHHRWRRVYDLIIFIGMPSFAGWDCLVCGKFVSNDELTPEGLGGVVTKAQRLCGPGECSDGSRYKEQLVDENGVLTIVR
jgi:hypothetical protein